MIEIKIPKQETISHFVWLNIDTGTEISNFGYVTDELFIHNIIFVRKGDNLLCNSYNKEMISAPYDGFLLRRPYNLFCDHNCCWIDDYYYHSSFRGKEEETVGFLFEDIEELNKFFFGSIDCSLFKDPFSSSHRIKGMYNGYCGWFRAITKRQDISFLPFPYLYYDSFICLEIAFDRFLHFGFEEDKAVVSFASSYTGWIHKGDTISLLFDNGDILDYTLTKKPVDKRICNFTLYQDDIDIFLNHDIVLSRITFADEECDVQDSEFFNSIMGDYAKEAIHYLISSYVEEIHRLVPSYQFPIKKTNRRQTGFIFNWCYVYLMKDTSNCYYKIGISNTPEYRERTLQSEKPTIEMLACKKYPTRKIAEAIESALHTAYSQQRLRGEWFNLNDADVAAIIETLK